MIRVLVVDDDVAICRTYARILSDVGHHVSTATTFADATAILRSSAVPFDVVLLDLKLDGTDAGPLLPLIGSRHRRAGVALISGWNDSDRWHQVVTKCDVAVPKPLGRDTLIRIVKQLDDSRLDGLVGLAKQSRLSERELRVLEEARTGATAKEIGARLGITKTTVDALMRRIFDKTGIRSAREILASARARFCPHRQISQPLAANGVYLFTYS